MFHLRLFVDVWLLPQPGCCEPKDFRLGSDVPGLHLPGTGVPSRQNEETRLSHIPTALSDSAGMSVKVRVILHLRVEVKGLNENGMR